MNKIVINANQTRSWAEHTSFFGKNELISAIYFEWSLLNFLICELFYSPNDPYHVNFFISDARTISSFLQKRDQYLFSVLFSHL